MFMIHPKDDKQKQHSNTLHADKCTQPIRSTTNKINALSTSTFLSFLTTKFEARISLIAKKQRSMRAPDKARQQHKALRTG
jgi:hypothetical protein